MFLITEKYINFFNYKFIGQQLRLVLNINIMKSPLYTGHLLEYKYFCYKEGPLTKVSLCLHDIFRLVWTKQNEYLKRKNNKVYL